MEYSKLIKERYSVRKYQDKKIPQEVLNQILEAGRIAPTAKNLQPQRIYVLESDTAKEKLGRFKKMSFEAPIVLMICADMNEVCKLEIEPGYDTSEIDCTIVATLMMLEATDLGLGSCFVRWFNSEELREAFNLEENIKPVCLLPIGYKREDAVPLKGFHDVRKTLDEEVTFL